MKILKIFLVLIFVSFAWMFFIFYLIPSDTVEVHNPTITAEQALEMFNLKDIVKIKNGGTDFRKIYDTDHNQGTYAVKLDPDDLKKIKSHLKRISKEEVESLGCPYESSAPWIPNEICGESRFNVGKYETYIETVDPKYYQGTVVFLDPNDGQVFIFTRPDYPTE